MRSSPPRPEKARMNGAEQPVQLPAAATALAGWGQSGHSRSPPRSWSPAAMNQHEKVHGTWCFGTARSTGWRIGRGSWYAASTTRSALAWSTGWMQRRRSAPTWTPCPAYAACSFGVE